MSAFVGALCVQSHLSGALPGLGLSQRAQGFLQWCSHTRTRWFLSTACTISCQVHNTAHTHTHTSTETNTSKHRYVVTYHMGRARGARFQGLSHRKWETGSEFSSSFQTNDPCSIVEHSTFLIMLTFIHFIKWNCSLSHRASHTFVYLLVTIPSKTCEYLNKCWIYIKHAYMYELFATFL